LLGGDVANSRDPIYLGHNKVHQNDVGTQGFRRGDSLSAVPGFAYDLNTWLCGQQGRYPLSDDLVIVSDQHAYGFAHHTPDCTSQRIFCNRRNVDPVYEKRPSDNQPIFTLDTERLKQMSYGEWERPA
jgi:hypothetical protein